jgi:peroxiredoxin
LQGTPQTIDDGAYDHLRAGIVVPPLSLPATTGPRLDLVGPTPFTVVFLYPMTGVPGRPLPPGWLELPGAFGCTAESCAYRDLSDGFARLGASIRGISTQTTSEQKEFAERERLDYPLLSDSEHRLVEELHLPLLEVLGHPPRIVRATLILDRDRVLREVMYPVPDPAANAADALVLVDELAGHRR